MHSSLLLGIRHFDDNAWIPRMLVPNDASGSYLDFLPDEALSAGSSITVERAGRTFCAKRASLPDPLRNQTSPDGILNIER